MRRRCDEQKKPFPPRQQLAAEGGVVPVTTVQFMPGGRGSPLLLPVALDALPNGRSAKKWHQWPSASAAVHHDEKAARARLRVACEVMTANRIAGLAADGAVAVERPRGIVVHASFTPTIISLPPPGSGGAPGCARTTASVQECILRGSCRTVAALCVLSRSRSIELIRY